MSRRTLTLTILGAAILLLTPLALAQSTPPAAPRPMGLWPLFVQSFDAFTVLLVTGSIAALAVVFSCLIDIRTSKILPRRSVDVAVELTSLGRWEDLRDFVATDESFLGRVVRAAMKSARVSDREGVREAAELAAAEESARWFRRIELLNVIGNLGPLVGLAGTVWGMILAFTSLGESGGQAGPTDLSLGISKALFHTLLGLCLAIPSLLAFGMYRSVLDRICTRATVLSGQIIDRLPVAEPDGPARTQGPDAAGAIAAKPIPDRQRP